MAPPFSAGEVVGGRYRLDRQLGKGGMGAVWLAQNTELGLSVAIKFLDDPDAEADMRRRRFEREARLVAKIESPHVVKVFDYGTHGEVPFLVMEVLRGEDLNTALKRERRLPPEHVARIVEQVAKGLRRAHDLGIVHRDLKPANIFLQESDDGTPLVKILDFGIARSVAAEQGETLTESGATIGSPHYMSPEQARGLPHVDHRTDTWALGVVAFRCLTGRLPFPGKALGDIVLSVCTAPIPRMSEVAPDLSPDWDAFFARALARDPDERFQTARELARHLTAIVHGADPSALPEASSSSGQTPPVPVQVPGPIQEADATTRLSTTTDAMPVERTRRAPIAVAISAVAVVAAVLVGVKLFGGNPQNTASSASAPATVVVYVPAPAPTPTPSASTEVAVGVAEPSTSAQRSATAPRATSRPPTSRPPAPASTFDFGLP